MYKKIYLSYRNYRNLHSKYYSLLNNNEISLVYASSIKIPKAFFYFYRFFRKQPIFNYVFNLLSTFFTISSKEDVFDLIYFASSLPQKVIGVNFVVDFEHVSALFNFIKPSKKQMESVKNILLHPSCKFILPWTQAAEETLYIMYPDIKKQLKKKTRVLYPAQEILIGKYKPTYRFVQRNQRIKFLFVGYEYRRKGLLEILESIKWLSRDVSNKVELTIITNLDKEIKSKVNLLNKSASVKINIFQASFNKRDLVRYFFLTHDIFLFPTHHDTFGMVILEALATGLPVITVDQFASKEIIRRNVNGFLLKQKYPNKDLLLDYKLFHDFKFDTDFNHLDRFLAKEIAKYITILTKRPDFILKLKQNTTIDLVPGGKFSIDNFRKKFLDLVRESTDAKN